MCVWKSFRRPPQHTQSHFLHWPLFTVLDSCVHKGSYLGSQFQNLARQLSLNYFVELFTGGIKPATASPNTCRCDSFQTSRSSLLSPFPTQTSLAAWKFLSLLDHIPGLRICRAFVKDFHQVELILRNDKGLLIILSPPARNSKLLQLSPGRLIWI